MPNSRGRTIWLSTAVVGMALVCVGLSAFSIDYVAVGQFYIIEKHYDAFLIDHGRVFCLLIGLIGWAASLGKTGRARVATLTLLLPVVVVLVASLSLGTNAHGVFPLFVLSMAPMLLVGVVVAIMATRARDKKTV